MLVTLWENLIEHERIVSVQAKHHFSSLFVRLALRVDVLNDLTGKRVKHQLVHLRANELPEALFLSVKWRIVIQFGGEVVRVLLLHQMSELVFELVDNEYTLRPVAKLDERLQDAAAVMLVAKFRVLLSDGVDALLHNSMLLLATHLFLFHEQSIVRDAQLFDQIRHLLLLAPIQDGLLACICFRLILILERTLA